MEEQFKLLRQEITERVKILHWLLAIATILDFLSLIFILQIKDQDTLISFLLFWPLAISLLIFNYQSNQMTMEAVAKYLMKSEESEVSGWDKFYGQYKKSYRFLSFFKTLPLLIPIFIPVFILIGGLASSWQNYLAYIDLAFLILVILNFRYKFGK